jgi:hypothetical protein
VNDDDGQDYLDDLGDDIGDAARINMRVLARLGLSTVDVAEVRADLYAIVDAAIDDVMGEIVNGGVREG